MKDIKYKGITIYCSHKYYTFYIYKAGVGHVCDTLKKAKQIIKDSI